MERLFVDHLDEGYDFFTSCVSLNDSPFCCGIQKVMFLYPFSKLWLPGACCRLSHQSIFCEVLNDFEGFFGCQKLGERVGWAVI